MKYSCACQCHLKERQRALQSAVVEMPKNVYDNRPAAGQCLLSRALHRYISMSGGSLQSNPQNDQQRHLHVM